MKKNILLVIISTIGLVGVGFAQDKDENPVTVSVGATLNYYYGPGDRNFSKFENDRVNWQINTVLGYTLAYSKSGKRTQVAAFGHFGFNNGKTIVNLLKDQGFTTTATSQSSANNFYQLEGGFIIGDLLRLSAGVGQQNFDTQTLLSTSGNKPNTKLLKYNSATVGLQFNVATLQWVINCNFATGQDFDNTVITPSTGLLYRF